MEEFGKGRKEEKEHEGTGSTYMAQGNVEQSVVALGSGWTAVGIDVATRIEMWM